MPRKEPEKQVHYSLRKEPEKQVISRCGKNRKSRSSVAAGRTGKAGHQPLREENGEKVTQKTLRERMEEILPFLQIKYDEPMDRHCSFHTGGRADALTFVRTEQEMAELLELLRAEGEDFFILGKGTNLLIGDGGYRGVIVTAVGQDGTDGSRGTGGFHGAEAQRKGLKSRDESPVLDEIRVQGNRIIAGAGATLKAVALAARDHGLRGLEFAAGIPGTVGGGLVMNAGAYNGEMKQVVSSVRILMPDGSLRVFSGEEMQFEYRTSILRKTPAIALGAEFVLEEGDPEDIRRRILELSALRREKQPLEYPSAGSTFKRPKGYFAGKLIMDAGLRGYSVGGAQVSEKHCGFVINRGGATSAQIRRLIEDVQARVFEESGIKLEREVIFLGEF